MTIKEKVDADVTKYIRGSKQRISQNEVKAYRKTRTNYYTSMDKMDKGHRLALIDLLFQLTHGPFAIIDFLIKHPIKTIKAILQAILVGVSIYIAIYLYKGGDITQLLNIFMN